MVESWGKSVAFFRKPMLALATSKILQMSLNIPAIRENVPLVNGIELKYFVIGLKFSHRGMFLSFSLGSIDAIKS